MARASYESSNLSPNYAPPLYITVVIFFFSNAFLPTDSELNVLCHSTSKEVNYKPGELAKMKTLS